MNATYNMDHLQAITHVTSLLNTQATLGATAKTTPGATAKATLGTTAISKPKTSVTNHYDSAGQDVATVSNTSFEGVTFAADGTILGGTLSHESEDFDMGTKLNNTSLNFLGNGKPGSAQINVNNVNGEGIFKQVQMDMGGATWNESFAISSGQVTLSSIDGQTQKKLHDCSLQFNNESIVSGSITHYDPDQGAVAGYTEVDYSGTKFLGTSIVGGQYSVKRLNTSRATNSNSAISLSSLGRLQTIQSTNMDPVSAAVTSIVRSDFSQVVFNARNEFVSGNINITANDSRGNLISQTTLAINNSSPSLSTTLVYNKGQVQNKVVVDYSNAQFNNNKQVVNSTKKVDIYSGGGKLLASTTVAYDKFGKKIAGNKAPATAKTTSASGTKIQTTAPAKAASAKTAAAPTAVAKPVSARPAKKQTTAPAKTAAAKIAAALAATAKPASAKTATGSQAQSQLTSATGSTKTDEIRRADGSLEQTRVIAMDGDTPTAAYITLYAGDGVTVIKSFDMDLSGLNYDPNSQAASGSLIMTSYLGENTLNSHSTIQY
jgi:hypothetical protein